MLDLRRLRLLRELQERGTIAAVADALRFTPSAVSQQLAQLEREAGVKLLVRAGRGVRLTDPALVLVGHAGDGGARARRAPAALRAGRGRARAVPAGARPGRRRPRHRRGVAAPAADAARRARPARSPRRPGAPRP